MRLRSRFDADINLVDDYGDIYVGPLVISWCNQGDGEHGSFGLNWSDKWHLYMTYYEPCDPFNGSTHGWPGFVDWELCVYNDTVKCWSSGMYGAKLKKWAGKHLRRT